MTEHIEFTRPAEWLRLLQETPGAYAILVSDSDGFARAAYRLARAHCRIQPLASNLPTVRELGAAATTLARYVIQGGAQIDPLTLARECEALGLRVILPVTSAA
jgi:hypothetical protein